MSRAIVSRIEMRKPSADWKCHISDFSCFAGFEAEIMSVEQRRAQSVFK